MRYLNKRARGALWALGLIVAVAPAAAQQQPVGVPSVAPPGGEATPPPGLPGNGPSATSGAAATARFDEVGYAAIDEAMRGVTVTAAKLRPGRYAEITALGNGHVILAAVAAGAAPTERLARLSPGAARALGVAGHDTIAVRIREVQPQAGDEAALKRGAPASARLDAPLSLLAGLRARLADVRKAPPPAVGNQAKAAVAAGPAPTAPHAHLTPPPSHPPQHIKPMPPKAELPKAAVAPPQHAKQPAGRYHVQVGAFANQGNARRLAAKLGGHVTKSGKLWLVELGPFADAGAAQQARDGAAKRGYGDARVRKD